MALQEAIGTQLPNGLGRTQGTVQRWRLTRSISMMRERPPDGTELDKHTLLSKAGGFAWLYSHSR